LTFGCPSNSVTSAEELHLLIDTALWCADDGA